MYPRTLEGVLAVCLYDSIFHISSIFVNCSQVRLLSLSSISQSYISVSSGVEMAEGIWGIQLMESRIGELLGLYLVEEMHSIFVVTSVL